jgi:hypothetical protein
MADLESEAPIIEALKAVAVETVVNVVTLKAIQRMLEGVSHNVRRIESELPFFVTIGLISIVLAVGLYLLHGNGLVFVVVAIFMLLGWANARSQISLLSQTIVDAEEHLMEAGYKIVWDKGANRVQLLRRENHS